MGDNMRRTGMCLALLLGTACQAAPPAPHAFGVLNHRSLQATAAYWNPILAYVSTRSGVPLELHIGRTANETTDRVVAGKLDFAYTNHLFTPKRHKLGWRVLARQDTRGGRGRGGGRGGAPGAARRGRAGGPGAGAGPDG